MRKEKLTNESDVKVRLKPIFNIKPGVYLTGLYLLILLVILFFIFVFPGIRNYGSKFSFTSKPESTLVFVDNQYRDTTPCSIFIKSGNHKIVLKKKYFQSITLNKKVSGRLFFSLILPRREHVLQSMVLVEPEKYLKKRFSEISGYALMNDFYDGYQYPPLITQTVKEFSEGSDPEKLPLLYDFLYSMRMNFGNPALVKDLKSGIDLLLPDENKDKSEFDTIKTFYTAHGFKTNGLLLSYLAAIPSDKREQVEKELAADSDIKKIIASLPGKKTLHVENSSGLKNISFNGFSFIGIPGGNFTSGVLPQNSTDILADNVLQSFPHQETVRSFYMQDREVTAGQFQQFLNDNPGWDKTSISELIKKKYVTEDYLTNYNPQARDVPVSNISWFAADAFCRWLTEQLPKRLSKFEVHLPTEAQWEWAAELNLSENTKKIFNQTGAVAANFQRQGKIGISDMLGNLWEWSNNFYFPTDTEYGGFGMRNLTFEGSEKSIRGGSWANDKDIISTTTRGSQPPSWCTPFLGFRVVLVSKNK